MNETTKGGFMLVNDAFTAEEVRELVLDVIYCERFGYPNPNLKIAKQYVTVWYNNNKINAKEREIIESL